jgi:mannose-1-phosphate guanylyltransferase/phosphomannomutase
MRLVTVVTKLFLETHKHLAPYRIAVPVEATQEIERVAAEYGVQVVRIKNSHAAMMEATRAGDIAFVGGTRGGFIFTEYMFASDALYSISKILEMLARTGYVLAELDQSLPKRHQARVSIPCPWDAKGHVMRRAMEFSGEMRRDLIDGVKVFNDENDTSVLLVPDKEKGEFTVIAEANDSETAKDEADRFVMHVSSWRDE